MCEVECEATVVLTRFAAVVEKLADSKAKKYGASRDVHVS